MEAECDDNENSNLGHNLKKWNLSTKNKIPANKYGGVKYPINATDHSPKFGGRNNTIPTSNRKKNANAENWNMAAKLIRKLALKMSFCG